MSKSDIYSDAAYFGRFMVSVSALLAVITAVVLLVSGIMLLFQGDVHSFSTVGTVSNVNCQPLQNGKKRCSLVINYLVNGRSLQIQEEVDTSKEYTQGSQVSVYYDPDRPEDALATQLTQRQLGLSLIVGSAILLLIALVVVWLSRKYKFFSAAYGVGEVVGMIL